MATSVVSQQQSSHTMMSQSYKREVSKQTFQLKSPDGDLKDVEADFQSLVNEMAKEGSSKRVVEQQEQRNYSSSSQLTITNGTSGKSSSKSSVTSSSTVSSKSGGGFQPSDSGIVTARPARVVPTDQVDYTQRGGGESEVIVEKSMRVRDRVKKLETQLSQEDLTNSPVPEALMSPRYKSSSIKNLADQFTYASNESIAPSVNAQAFSQAKDSVELISSNAEFKGVRHLASAFDKAEMSSQEDLSSRKLDGEFRSVKETASKFIEPIQPKLAQPKADESKEEEEELAPPVAVLPPATMRKAAASPPPPRPAMPTPSTLASIQPAYAPPSVETPLPTAPWRKPERGDLKKSNSMGEELRGFEEALTEMNKFTDTLATDSTESRSTSAETVVQQPIQYSAKVTCEVRSRVNTPEVVEQNPFSSSTTQQATSKNITETKVSSTRRSRSETKTSTTSSMSSSTSSGSRGVGVANQKVTSPSAFGEIRSTPTSTRPTPVASYSSSSSSYANSTGKPPKSDPIEPNKLSLLRSSSTGSVASDLKETRTMTRIGSEKDLPKFNIKKIRPAPPRKSNFWNF